MKSTSLRMMRTIGLISAILALTAQSAFADFNYSYRDRYKDGLMPVSRGTLTAADVQIYYPSKMELVSLALLHGAQTAATTAMNQQSAIRNVLTATTAGVTTAIVTRALKTAVNIFVKNDKIITRTEMIYLFNSVKSDNVVTAQEFADLKTLLNNPSIYPMVNYVANLAKKLVFGNPWNSTYQGAALGNLTAGSTGAQLGQLVDKWFFGKDHPDAGYYAGTPMVYVNPAGSLFVNGATYQDINQGELGDCWLMAAYAEIALREPSVITSMFTDNLDNTYTVRFYHNGLADYTTIDKMLPVYSVSGQLAYASWSKYANDPSVELWVPLAEKAYVQSMASWGSGPNAYSTLNGGWIGTAFRDISNRKVTIGSALVSTNVKNTWAAGAYVGFASKTTPLSQSVVGSHAYAMVSYNAAGGLFKLYNPWGKNGGTIPEFLIFSWTQIIQNFDYFDYALK